MYELRPLSTGEILDRTFSLYRSRFLLFAGIAALAAVVRLIGQAMQLAMPHQIIGSGTLHLSVPNTSAIVSLPFSLLFLVAFSLTQAATIWAMSEVYLGRSATVADSLRATGRGSLRYVGIAFWQAGSFTWPVTVVGLLAAGLYFANGRTMSFGVGFLLVLLALGALVAGFLFYLRNLLAIPITVREGLGVRASMRRSKTLVHGAKGKLFLVLLVAFALSMVEGILLSTVLFVSLFVFHGVRSALPTEILVVAITFVAYALIAPVIMIGIGLVYFDQRVRQEAFDVAVLLGDEATPGAFAAAPAPVAAGPVPEPPGGASGL